MDSIWVLKSCKIEMFEYHQNFALFRFEQAFSILDELILHKFWAQAAGAFQI